MPAMIDRTHQEAGCIQCLREAAVAFAMLGKSLGDLHYASGGPARSDQAYVTTLVPSAMERKEEVEVRIIQSWHGSGRASSGEYGRASATGRSMTSTSGGRVQALRRRPDEGAHFRRQVARAGEVRMHTGISGGRMPARQYHQLALCQVGRGHAARQQAISMPWAAASRTGWSLVWPTASCIATRSVYPQPLSNQWLRLQ